MVEILKVSSKGQVVIPEHIRNSYGIKKGARLILREKGRQLLLQLEQDFMEGIQEAEAIKEKRGWLLLGEQSLRQVWDNPEDEEVWGKYL